ncbi:MAG: hypothetical protein QOG01_3054 [Pseudonocardiales bacterium]|nr:hypothetical protein [Pseudonocardiales bacterium]
MKRLLSVVLAMLVLAGCTSSGSTNGTPGPTVTGTKTVVHTLAPTGPAPFRPPAPATVRPLAPGAKPHPGEKDKSCPYIRSGLNEDNGGGVNLADIEGDRVYRTTVLTSFRPVGCRFYFYAPPYEAVADIRPRTFRTAVETRNAMILTARTGTELITERNFVKGVDGICFRTKFFGEDGKRDWAFAFAKGKVLVVVYTQRYDTSRNALYIAQAIAGKF